MNAKEIIAKLIDEHKISGEEAVCLIQAITTPLTITYEPPKYEPVKTPYGPPYTITCDNKTQKL